MKPCSLWDRTTHLPPYSTRASSKSHGRICCFHMQPHCVKEREGSSASLPTLCSCVHRITPARSEALGTHRRALCAVRLLMPRLRGHPQATWRAAQQRAPWCSSTWRRRGWKRPQARKRRARSRCLLRTPAARCLDGGQCTGAQPAFAARASGRQRCHARPNGARWGHAVCSLQQQQHFCEGFSKGCAHMEQADMLCVIVAQHTA